VPQRNEVPWRRTTLSPFLLSKYELTQGQWLRLTGQNPSQFVGKEYSPRFNRAGRSADLTHPVQSVSWTEARAVLERHGLTLPTEAQWEYAARAGTTTTWWTGATPTDLARAANLLDQWAKANGYPSGEHEAWDDGNTVPAPVGSYDPNPFGFHDVHGNVWEWCLDAYLEYAYSHGQTDDPLVPTYAAETRVYRGGSFNSSAAPSRCAFRSWGTPELVGPYLGVRPARRIER
jgi:formylglycine-generating enzyme required for sulfatase activity